MANTIFTLKKSKMGKRILRPYLQAHVCDEPVFFFANVAEHTLQRATAEPAISTRHVSFESTLLHAFGHQACTCEALIELVAKAYSIGGCNDLRPHGSGKPVAAGNGEFVAA